jgi:hypothetical protein
MKRLLLAAFVVAFAPSALAQVQAAKKATAGVLGGNWYGSVEVRHHANAYYDEGGAYERVDPSMHVRAQFGAQFYEGMVDAYATLGVFKETQTQQILQRQPEIAVDLYPVKNEHVQILQYNFVQLPVKESNTSKKQTEEELADAYNPSTVYTVGLAPTLKLPTTYNGTRIELKTGADGWTRLYSRRQYVEGQDQLAYEDDEARSDDHLALNAPQEEEPIEDYAPHYQAQEFAGVVVSPAFARSFTAEASGHYHTRFTPVYTPSETGGTDYEYAVHRYSYARVRMKYDLTERLAVTNDFYSYKEGLFAGDRKGTERRYRNVLRMSCRL